jgi:alpha-1,3-rhamnosyl/mannosyltransferase
VHDLSVLRFTEWHPADRVKWYEAGFRRGLKQTEHFIAVSQFTKREMIELLGIAPGRITTIHQGPREIFTPAAGEEYQPQLRQLDVTPPFFLFVGTLEPRKNLSAVLRAYHALPGALRQRHQLVIAGGIGWGELGDVAGGENIRLVGYVSDETLRLLYSACHAFLWPSLYEGFGLPPLECMACGRPVITSNAASLPEVVGDAAVTIDPADVAALTTAMQRLAEDDDHAERLARAGLRRAAEFSWTRCAQQHAEVFLKFV